MPVSSYISLSREAQAELKQLVWQVLDKAVEDRTMLQPAPPTSPALLIPRACFVTLYADKQLRGCIGTYAAEKSLWQNVCDYSYYSACEDCRFEPLQKRELPNLSFEISVLSALQPLANKGERALLDQLQIGIDGLLLKDSYYSAIFLPSVWHSLKTAEEFVNALKIKAGWPEDYWREDIKIFRFETFVIEGSQKTFVP
ncbi:AMMECR1 domain protein [Psychromonas ingrahamii 37]|uniref:AMMECR1 domain protein n=1 Tax=Psychromonas ingrahamii (strain DSM 17664 / CCUG 51855 / 37) TaxID=357804 RepID=A1SXX3_PSYIN|nr:AmmeMemoRadiSam system protein A [Psychromonas ingrahamii]ABM04338.1 AMMECR1 domain protein [Psychromonas ingrahamii 37]